MSEREIIRQSLCRAYAEGVIRFDSRGRHEGQTEFNNASREKARADGTKNIIATGRYEVEAQELLERIGK